MEKSVRIILSLEASAVYDYISKRSLTCKQERILFNAIQSKADLIAKNPLIGQPVSKKLIPKQYVDKYGVQNIYRIELPMFWRLLYTIRDNDIEIIAFVMDIIDHRSYSKKFGYKN